MRALLLEESAMELIATHGQLFVILACIFGLFMAWGIGANDVANAIGTSVGSKALTVKQAIFVAVVFEFSGAFLAGGEVTETIRKGLFDISAIEDHADLLVFGMLGSLLAAGTWLLMASFKGWPVSTTHSLVGAVVGFAAVGISMEAVNWSEVGNIAASWVVSPVVAGSISYVLFRSIQSFILNKENPLAQSKFIVPWYIMMAGFVIAMVTLLKGLTHLGFDLTFAQAAGYSLLISIVVMIIGFFIVNNTIKKQIAANGSVEKVFAVLMVFTACAMAFAHGSNDVANAVGPLAAIVNVVSNGGDIAANSVMPSWILLLGGIGIVIGLATYGFKVMATIGKKITELTPSRGFAAELGAATTVVLASAIGLPVSTTHTLVGAVLGVGMARGISALDL